MIFQSIMMLLINMTLNVHKYLMIKNNNAQTYEKVFTVLLSFSSTLATKCVSLSNEPCMTRPTLFYFNHIKLYHYPFKISLDRCDGIFSVVDDLSTKVCVPSKTKDVNVKVLIWWQE